MLRKGKIGEKVYTRVSKPFNRKVRPGPSFHVWPQSITARTTILNPPQKRRSYELASPSNSCHFVYLECQENLVINNAFEVFWLHKQHVTTKSRFPPDDRAWAQTCIHHTLDESYQSFYQGGELFRYIFWRKIIKHGQEEHSFQVGDNVKTDRKSVV